MKSKAFFESLREYSEQKDIDYDILEEIFKKALLNAYKKTYGNTSADVILNAEKNDIKIVAKQLVVSDYYEDEEDDTQQILLSDAREIKKRAKVGDIITKNVDFSDFGRLAAEACKSVFKQNVKAREREMLYEKFKVLEDEMIDGVVVDIKDRGVSLRLLDKTTTFLPKQEFLKNDSFYEGQTVKVYVKKVEQTTKEPRIYVSRNENNIITRLLEDAVPEIKEGIIKIMGIARDAGDRTKIALYSTDPNVDPIGSCVGENGSRHKMVVDALNGEKLDLYKWSDDPKELIANSLQPADVTDVIDINLKEKTSVVIVPDNQLSLAIGKNGQNVRLAVQSCKWKIDIIPTSEAYQRGILF